MGNIIDGRYEVIQKIGEGGMGAVYLAQDLRLKRKVAVKRLLFQGKPANEEMFRQRFEREALAMANFQHPNIISVHDYGQDADGVYLVIEYMPGGVLSKQMRERRFSIDEAINILLPLADALQEIHRLGQVHRDIKPSNILFDKYNNPKLADFGVVKLLEGGDSNTLTATGMAVGTPEYMAPELIGGEASPATDQYALGVVFYELVTGKKPFKGRTPMETLTMQKTDPLPDPHHIDPELPAWICNFLQVALAKNPQDRFADIREFAMILREKLQDWEKTEVSAPFQDEDTVLDSITPPMKTSEIEETSPPSQGKKNKFLVWSVPVVIVLCLVGLWVVFGKNVINDDRGEVTVIGFEPMEALTVEDRIDEITPSPEEGVVPTEASESVETISPTTISTATKTMTITNTIEPTKIPIPAVRNFISCSESCSGSNQTDTFPEAVKKIYLEWDYENIPYGADYSRVWTMDGKEWVRYNCKWSGNLNGHDVVSLREPYGLHSGTWIVTIIVNGEELLKEPIYISGNWDYWDPAGTFNKCYDSD